MKKGAFALGLAVVLAPPAARAQSPEAAPPATDATDRAPPARFYAIGSVGVPRLFGVAAGARIGARFAAELELAGLPRGLAEFGEDSRTTKAASVSFFSLAANGAFFPTRAFPFYAGLGLGWLSATSETRAFGSAVSYTSSAFAITPRVGVEFLIRDRVAIGGAIGIPALIARDTTLDSDGQTSGNARKVANTFGAPVEERFSLFGFPFIAVRGGYVF